MGVFLVHARGLFSQMQPRRSFASIIPLSAARSYIEGLPRFAKIKPKTSAAFLSIPTAFSASMRSGPEAYRARPEPLHLLRSQSCAIAAGLVFRSSPRPRRNTINFTSVSWFRNHQGVFHDQNLEHGTLAITWDLQSNLDEVEAAFAVNCSLCVGRAFPATALAYDMHPAYPQSRPSSLIMIKVNTVFGGHYRDVFKLLAGGARVAVNFVAIPFCEHEIPIPLIRIS
jgi:hypothetical protein